MFGGELLVALRSASLCADWMKPRDRSVNFSISTICPPSSAPLLGTQSMMRLNNYRRYGLVAEKAQEAARPVRAKIDRKPASRINCISKSEENRDQASESSEDSPMPETWAPLGATFPFRPSSSPSPWPSPWPSPAAGHRCRSRRHCCHCRRCAPVGRDWHRRWRSACGSSARHAGGNSPWRCDRRPHSRPAPWPGISP